MIKQNEIKVLLMAKVHGGNLHHPDTEAIKGRCIRTNFYHYILKCIKCPDIRVAEKGSGRGLVVISPVYMYM